MVSHSGAVSEELPKYNITNPQNGIDYAASQVANGYSVRVHVDRDGDTKGDHWVAISYCTIEISTQKPIAFGFFDPGTVSQKKKYKWLLYNPKWETKRFVSLQHKKNIQCN